MPTERDERIARLLEIQQASCFICQQPLKSTEKWDIDHIIPKAQGGRDDDNNYALVHERCNASKLDADLRVARAMAHYERIKRQVEDAGPNRPNLGDFLKEFGGGKEGVKIWKESDVVYLETRTTVITAPFFADPLCQATSFFADLPVEYVHHDSRINPRAVGDRVRSLIAEFLARRPQLHTGLAWIATDAPEPKINVFDGQHKAVAQLLLGARCLLLRVFVDPNLDVLLETNTRAGTVLRQVAFDKSAQRFLGSQIFAEKVRAYQQAKGLMEDDLNFSETDLVRHFRGEHREMRKYILDNIRAAVIHDSGNRLRDYVEFGGKATEKPLSYNAIERTFFALFLNKEALSIPLDHKLDVGDNPRQLEREQLVELMNLFYHELLEGSYDFDRGTYRIEEQLRKGEDIPDPHLRAVRLCREEILYNVLRYVRDCVKRYFLLTGLVVEEQELFQKRLPPVLWEHIARVIRGIAQIQIWVNKDPNVSSSIFGGKQTYDYWKHVFETGTAPGGQRILAKPLNLDDLIKP